MAIDFMIMPLSRYIAGDFVSPSMQLAWDMGTAYTIFGPEGAKQYPPGVPFGGPDAAERRMRIVDEIRRGSPASCPRPCRHDSGTSARRRSPASTGSIPASFGALLEEASKRSRGFLGIFGKKPSHLAALLMLPCPFDAPFPMDSPISCDVSSVPRALAELRSTTWSAPCASAVETLGEALDDAVRLQLPLVVDL